MQMLLPWLLLLSKKNKKWLLIGEEETHLHHTVRTDLDSEPCYIYHAITWCTCCVCISYSGVLVIYGSYSCEAKGVARGQATV